MSTRLYKINGEYNTFEYWHDHYGYTKTPTFSIQYKTTNPWGAAFASDGYYDAEDLMDIFTFSFFVPGVVGWYSIDDLALVGYYPAAATDLTVARDSEVSNAATLTQDNETYYLVQNDIEYGWMSQAEFEARGWSTDVGDPPSYIVFDTTTGTIVHSIVEEGLVYGEVGYVLMDEAGSMITVYETGVKTESFYFTSNGRNETQNTNISHADIPVYNEDGTAPAADTPYNGSSVLAFMDVTGNTKQADGESLYLDDGELRLDAPDTNEGEQWAALVEKVFPDILTLWAKITDNSEKMYLQTRVINTSTPNSTYLYALYTDEALTQRFVIDSNKIYEFGVFKGQNFVPYDIQDVSQMPSTTVSGSGAVYGYLLVDQSGAYLWAATRELRLRC